MKAFHKRSAVTALAIFVILGLVGSAAVLAATTPDLGAAASYAILASSYINTSASTTIQGDVGFTTGPAQAPLGVHPNYGSGAPYSTAGTDQGVALVDLNNQSPCTILAGNLNAVTVLGNAPGVIPPGCYSMVGAMNVTTGTTVTLDLTASGGNGSTWIFRPSGALTTEANATIDTINGASACNVFWTPIGATTLGADNTFEGTIIDDADISVGDNTEVLGRALAFGGMVTTGTAVTIDVTSCASSPAAFVVNKVIVNDDGGSMTIADFPLFVGATAVTHGVSSNFAAGVYTVSETTNAGYTQSFSGNCNAGGVVTLAAGANAACTITNDDIEQSSGGGGGGFITPPLIDVVKVPSPLALPNGPGGVTYSYTVRNIGPVAMTNVTTVDDSCGPLTLVSGDSNANATLEVSETWSYTCSTTLSSTHTNTVTATGWANGINAVDVAVATVVVGEPIVPPLIHVTKVPNPLFLPVAGGLVTYTERITNPGTVPLANVTLVDDKCSPLSFISGDVDGDALLDTTETWTYTCARNLTQTTTNTATATGEANGIRVTDFAIATVVVGVPGFPETGIAPESAGTPWSIVIVGMLMVVATSGVVALRKRTN